MCNKRQNPCEFLIDWHPSSSPIYHQKCGRWLHYNWDHNGIQPSPLKVNEESRKQSVKVVCLLSSRFSPTRSSGFPVFKFKFFNKHWQSCVLLSTVLALLGPIPAIHTSVCIQIPDFLFFSTCCHYSLCCIAWPKCSLRNSKSLKVPFLSWSCLLFCGFILTTPSRWI